MSEAREATTEKLARALEEAGAPADMIEKARDGYYDDYKSDLPFPILVLVRKLEAAGLTALAQRAKDGEFDAQQWEAEEWAQSPEGVATFRELMGGR